MNRSTLLRSLRRLTATVVILTLAIGVSGAVAGAAGTGTVISPGLNTTGGTVTADAGGATRTLTSDEAASMMQPLVAAMYYGNPQVLTPPDTATRYTIVFDYVFTADDPDTTGQFTVDYAQQGSAGWISMPQQALWPGSAVTADTAGQWFGAGTAFVAGFNGQGTIKTFTDTTASSTTSSGSSSNNTLVIVLVVIGAVVLLGGAFVVVRRRRTNA